MENEKRGAVWELMESLKREGYLGPEGGIEEIQLPFQLTHKLEFLEDKSQPFWLWNQ